MAVANLNTASGADVWTPATIDEPMRNASKRAYQPIAFGGWKTGCTLGGVTGLFRLAEAGGWD
ncbi:phage protein [Anopheles sinensis]|uniref:Phage protein n=1 Tax=Anopheles sinensis TaxID=74873 RepID=A0A084W525_ANOSI|nr:phage protein [Anopheles sinensis]